MMRYYELRVPYIGCAVVEELDRGASAKLLDAVFWRYDIELWVGRWAITLSLPDYFDRRKGKK